MIGKSPILEIDQCPCSTGKTLKWIIRPVILALLYNSKKHGYILVKELQQWGKSGRSLPDISGIYKILKTMEKEGLVSSTWILEKDSSPIRQYSITKKGEICMERWIETLKLYKAHIESLLKVLEKSKEKSRKEDK